MATQSGQRAQFRQAAAALQRASKVPGKSVLTQSYLRFEAALSTTATNYKFDVLVNESTQATNWVTQQKLAIQDAFYVGQIGFFLILPQTAGGYDSPLYTYPAVGGPNSGVTNQLTAATAVVASTIWHGNMQLIIDQRTVLTAWDLMRHYKVPVTQNNFTTTGVATGAPTAPYHAALDSSNFADDGFYPCEPNIVLNGGNKNILSVNLPAPLTGITTNGRLVIIMRGLLAQNASNLNG